MLKFEGINYNGKKWTGKGYEPTYKKPIYEINEGKGYIKEYEDSGFYPSKLVLEGEYFDGEINGKAKEYNNWGALKFEGE